jgi:hypothetical protein
VVARGRFTRFPLPPRNSSSSSGGKERPPEAVLFGAHFGAKRAEGRSDSQCHHRIPKYGHERAWNFDFIILPYLNGEAGDGYADFVQTVNTTRSEQKDSSRGFVVFPGAIGRIESPANWTRISPQYLDKALEMGHSTLSITGCLTYITFGAVHHTSFCYSYQKSVIDFRNLKVCGGAHQIAD